MARGVWNVAGGVRPLPLSVGPLDEAEPGDRMAPPAGPLIRRLRRRGAWQQLEIPTSSLWCQRWNAGRVQKWRLAQPGERFDAGNYTVERIDRATAAAFVKPRHYSGSHVACRQSFGLKRDGELVGVAAYCVTSEAALTRAYPELKPGVESLECGRFLVADPEPGNVETWFDARCREYLFASGVQAVLSFADPVPRIDAHGRAIFSGHVGYLYQGGGYLLAGRGEARTQWMLPDGSYLNGFMMQKIRKQKPGHEAAERRLVDAYGARPIRAGEKPAAWLRDAVRDDPAVGVTLVRHGGCHRYLRVLGTARQRRQIRIGHEVTINRELRADWAALDDDQQLPFGPYPKAPDVVRARNRAIRRRAAEHG